MSKTHVVNLNFNMDKKESVKTSSIFKLKRSPKGSIMADGKFSGFNKNRDYIIVEPSRINAPVNSNYHFNRLKSETKPDGNSTILFFRTNDMNLTAVSGQIVERIKDNKYYVDYKVIAIDTDSFSEILDGKTNLESVKNYKVSGSFVSSFKYNCFEVIEASSDKIHEEELNNPSWCKNYF